MAPVHHEHWCFVIPTAARNLLFGRDMVLTVKADSPYSPN